MLPIDKITVSISMPKEKAQELKELAKSKGYTKSGLIRSWVYQMMSEEVTEPLKSGAGLLNQKI